MCNIVFWLFLTKVNIDNDISKMLPEDSPSMINYDEVNKVFGGSNIIIVGLEQKNGSVLSEENIRMIQAISEEAKTIIAPSKKKNLLKTTVTSTTSYAKTKLKEVSSSSIISEDASLADDLLGDFGDGGSLADDLLGDFDDGGSLGDDLLGDFGDGGSLGDDLLGDFDDGGSLVDDLLGDFGDGGSLVDDLLGDFDDGGSLVDDLLGDFGDGETTAMEQVIKHTKTARPMKPSGVKIEQKNNGVLVTWDSLANNNATKLVVRYAKSKLKETEEVDARRNSLLVTHLDFDEWYRFEVFCENEQGEKSPKVYKWLYVELPESYSLVNSVMSLTTTDFLTGSEEGIEVTPMVDFDEAIPSTDADFDEIRNKIKSWDLYDLNLLSKDERSAAIYVKLADNLKVPHHEFVYNELEKIIAKYVNEQDFNVHISGLPAITLLIGRLMLKDLAFLIPFVIIVVLLSLYFSLRRFRGVVLPLLGVLISTIWALGLMSMLGKRVDLVGSAMPILLIAVGSAYGIHVMTHYYEELKARAFKR